MFLGIAQLMPLWLMKIYHNTVSLQCRQRCFIVSSSHSQKEHLEHNWKLHEVICRSIIRNLISPNLCNRIYPITIETDSNGILNSESPHFCRVNLAKVFHRSKATSTFRCGETETQLFPCHPVSCSCSPTLPEKNSNDTYKSIHRLILIFYNICIFDMNSFFSNTHQVCTLNK